MRTMIFHSLLSVAGATSLYLIGCGSTDSSVGSYQGAIQGHTCEVDGATSEAADGPESCTCMSGRWSCTATSPTAATSDEPCAPGDTKPASDGCNTCHCDGEGNWSCSQQACGRHSTTGMSKGHSGPPDDAAPMAPSTGMCCCCGSDASSEPDGGGGSGMGGAMGASGASGIGGSPSAGGGMGMSGAPAGGATISLR